MTDQPRTPAENARGEAARRREECEAWLEEYMKIRPNARGECDHLVIRREEIDVGLYGTVVRYECIKCGKVFT